MANQTVWIINPTTTALTNVNAAGDDIPARSMGKDGLGTTVILTDLEQATLAAASPKAIFVGSTCTADERRAAARLLKPFTVVQR